MRQSIKYGIAGGCIVLILLIVVGMALSPDNPGTSTEDQGVQLNITTAGSWSGSYLANGTTSSISGNGNKLVDLNTTSGDIVSATIQKEGGGTGELKVDIIKNGKVVKSASTNTGYGVVSLSS